MDDFEGILRGLLPHQEWRTGAHNKEEESAREDCFHCLETRVIVASETAETKIPILTSQSARRKDGAPGCNCLFWGGHAEAADEAGAGTGVFVNFDHVSAITVGQDSESDIAIGVGSERGVALTVGEFKRLRGAEWNSGFGDRARAVYFASAHAGTRRCAGLLREP